MRELKFRVWDGELMHYNARVGGFDETRPTVYKCCGMISKWVNVEPLSDKEIMQYTGLMDKNGKEIYEGDIIQSKSEMVRLVTNEPTGRIAIKNYTVRWEHEIARWGRFKDGKFELLSGLKKEYLDQWYTVIGNIYENPELIGE